MTFRLPWVSRAVADSIERRRVAEEERFERERQELRADLTRERIRSAKLTAFILRLKRDGAVLLPEAAFRYERAPHREMAPIEKAIDDNAKARRNPALRKHLMAWAEDQARRGVSEETICEQLQSWDSVTEDDEEEEDAFAS